MRRNSRRIYDLPMPEIKRLLAWAEQTFGPESSTARAYRLALRRAAQRRPGRQVTLA